MILGAFKSLYAFQFEDDILIYAKLPTRSIHKTRQLPLHVLQQIRESSPHLLTRRQNLRSRKDEAIVSGIPQLDSHTVIGLCDLERIVHAITANLVDGCADRTAGERRAMHRLNGRNSALCQAIEFGRVWQDARAGVAVRVHPKLAVRVNVHVQLHALASSDAVKLCFQGLGLDTIAS